MKKIITAEKAPAAIGPYSQAVLAGNLLFMSGQLPIDPATGEMVEATILAQTAQSIKNIQSVLQKAGGSLENVVKTTVFLKDMNDFAQMNGVYQTFFKTDCPARSTMQVAHLPKDSLVEIEAIALL